MISQAASMMPFKFFSGGLPRTAPKTPNTVERIMTFQTAVFWTFSTVLVFAALCVIFSRNPVHSALWLVLSFFSAAGVWMLLHA